jgi:hypothetical protein
MVHVRVLLRLFITMQTQWKSLPWYEYVHVYVHLEGQMLGGGFRALYLPMLFGVAVPVIVGNSAFGHDPILKCPNMRCTYFQ